MSLQWLCHTFYSPLPPTPSVMLFPRLTSCNGIWFAVNVQLPSNEYEKSSNPSNAWVQNTLWPWSPYAIEGSGLWALFEVSLGRIYDSATLTHIRLKIPGTRTILTHLKFGLNMSGCSFGTIHYQNRKGNKNSWDFLELAEWWDVWCISVFSCVYVSFPISLYKSDWSAIKMPWACSLW